MPYLQYDKLNLNVISNLYFEKHLHFPSITSGGGVNIPELPEGRPDPIGPGHRGTGAQLWLGTWDQRADQSERRLPR